MIIYLRTRTYLPFFAQNMNKNLVMFEILSGFLNIEEWQILINI